MAAPTPSPTNIFFTAQQLTELTAAPWVIAEGPSAQRNAFAAVPEAQCTHALRSIYKKEEGAPDAPTAAVVHTVLVSQSHQGARTMFLAITEKFKDLPLGVLTPLNIFPGLQPLEGPAAAIDGRWVDPATASCLATYEFTKPLEDGSSLKQVWAFTSTIGKSTCHQFVVDADDQVELLKKLVVATSHLN